MLVVKRSILPVDMKVPACLHMLVSLHGAALSLPGELFGLVTGKRFVQWIPPTRMLLHKLAAGQSYLLPLRFLLDFRYLRALVRYFAAQHLRQLLTIASEDLGILRTA